MNLIFLQSVQDKLYSLLVLVCRVSSTVLGLKHCQGFCGSNPAGTSQAENVCTHDIVWCWRLIACGIWPGSSELAGERDMKMRTG